MISVLILTKNEEVNIGPCIGAIPWRDDIWVLDSGSSDRTVAIATQMGARIHQRTFTDYADQRNFGLSLPFANDWILMLDSDERMTPGLAEEIERKIKSASATTAIFRVRRRDIFMGRWLRRSSGYPTWFPRVFRKGQVRVERPINEVYTTEGTIEILDHDLIHHPFNKGIDWWFERHNCYSSAEAELLTEKNNFSANSIANLVSKDPLMRRAALKTLFYRLPARPFLAFFYLYIARFGFLDGRAGYHYATMRMAYEIMIDAKVATKMKEACQGSRVQMDLENTFHRT